MFTFHSGSRSWKSEIRVPAARILVRAVFQACLQTTGFSSCVVTWLFLNDCWETEEKEGGRDAGREGERQGRSESFLFFYTGVWLIHTSCSFWYSDVKQLFIYIIGKDWCWEGLGAGGEGDDRGWDGWMASLTQWTWVWGNSGSWWWTGKPGVLQFMGSQRVEHDWATGLNWSTPSEALSLPSPSPSPPLQVFTEHQAEPCAGQWPPDSCRVCAW